MKKLKLITSLSLLGVLTTSLPIVATACSKDNNPTPAPTEIKISAKHANTSISEGQVIEVSQVDYIMFSENGGTNPVWSIDPTTGVEFDSTVGGLLSINEAPAVQTNYVVTCTCTEGISTFNLTLKKETISIVATYDYIRCPKNTPVNVKKNDTIQFYQLGGTNPVWTINPTTGVEISSDGLLTIKETLTEQTTLSVTCTCTEGSSTFNLILRPVVYTNTIKYDGQTYKLASNINTDEFCGNSKWNLSNYTEDGSELIIKDHSKLTELELKDVNPIVTWINNDFLYDCSNLTTLDLAGLTGIKLICSGFLYDCSSLTAIDLSPLQNAFNSSKFVPENFLYNCKSLTSIDLSPLQSSFDTIKSVPDGFLTSCEGLTTLDLTPLRNVTKVGDYFLVGCKGLTTLNIPFSGVTDIGQGFLTGCQGLTTLDIPLSKVVNIGDNFLSECSGLTQIKLNDLTAVESIGNYFLDGVTNLANFYLPNKDPSTFTVGTNNFMNNVPTACNLYAPKDLVNTYKNTSPWANRADYIKEVPADITMM